MTTAAGHTAMESENPDRLKTLPRVWLLHCLVFAIPLAATAFVWSGPHPWYTAPLFIIPLAIFQWWDTRAHFERQPPPAGVNSWPFDLLVYLLVAVHFLMLAGLLRLFAQQAIFSVDMVMVAVVVGASSGFSIITAHELIHRRQPWAQWLGRLMLCSVLYEHFYTEHLRGHHVRVGTSSDPATARYGETYREFWRRTVPGQFRSAWALEKQRLGDRQMSVFDPRMFRNRVVHGLLLGWGAAFTILVSVGWPAFVAFLLQAFLAVRLLEAVNYFEHWGLKRSGRNVQASDSWDTHSFFTYYGLIGLSRHADHHIQSSLPYQQLAVRDEAPLLPVGYVALVDMVLTRNDEFIAMAQQELRVRKLGPFASEPGREQTAESTEPGSSGWRLAGSWRNGPVWIRRGLLPLLALFLISLGVWVEAGEVQTFTGVLFRNLVIAGIFVFLLRAHAPIERRVQNGWFSWGLTFFLLWVIGAAIDPLIR